MIVINAINDAVSDLKSGPTSAQLTSRIQQKNLGLDAILQGQIPISQRSKIQLQQVHDLLRGFASDKTSLESDKTTQESMKTTAETQIATLETDIDTIEQDIDTKEIDRSGYRHNDPNYRRLTREIKTLTRERRSKMQQKTAQEKKLRDAERTLETINNKLNPLTNFLHYNQPFVTARIAEVFAMNNNVGHFQIGPTHAIPHQVVRYGDPTPTSVDLRASFLHTPTLHVDYSFSALDERGSVSLTNSGVKIGLKNGGEVVLQGLRLDPTTHTLTIQDLSVSGSDSLSFPLQLRDVLGIQAKYMDRATGQEYTCVKPLGLTINRNVLSMVDRRSTFSAYEGVVGEPTLRQGLVTHYETEMEKWEKEETYAILKTFPEFDALDESDQESLYQIVRGLHRPGTGLPLFPIVRNPGVNRRVYTNFVTDLLAQTPGDAMNSVANYEEWLRKSMNEHMKKYLQGCVKNYLGQNQIKNLLSGAVIAYSTGTRSTTHVSGDAMALDRHLAAHRARYGVAGGAMELLGGSATHTLSNQKVMVAGKEQSYTMKSSIVGGQSLSTEITFAGGKTKTYSAGSYDALMSHLLRNPLLEGDGLRMHLCFSLLKSFVSMAHARGIPLEGRVAGSMDRLAIVDESGILKVRQYAFDPRTRSETPRDIFDEGQFMKTKDIRVLRKGIEDIGRNFSVMMNNLHKQHQESKVQGLMKQNWGWAYLVPDNMNFDIVSNEGDSSVSGRCENFVYTLSVGGVEIPPSKDLRDILQHSAAQGHQMSIVRSVFGGHVDAYRTASKVKSKNFGVYDNKTDTTYMIDKHGNFGKVRGNISFSGASHGWKFWKSRRAASNYGQIGGTPSMTHLTEEEKNGLIQNPLLSGRLLKAMSQAL